MAIVRTSSVSLRKLTVAAVAASFATAFTAGSTTSSGTCTAFEKMKLNDSVKEFNFQQIKLIPLEIGKEFKTVKELDEVTSGQVLEQHMGTFGSVCFVVRRPGCILCREEGQALSQLAAAKDSLEGFGLFGVVKETGVDDEGLTEFYSNYFTYPLYRDVELSFYQALGNRKLTLPWNPIKLVQGVFSIFDMNKRLKAKNLSGNLVGEGFLKGGVIIFGTDGKPRYAYEEETGSELPLEDIKAALKSVKGETP